MFNNSLIYRFRLIMYLSVCDALSNISIIVGVSLISFQDRLNGTDLVSIFVMYTGSDEFEGNLFSFSLCFGI